jgi:hypothetical protein
MSLPHVFAKDDKSESTLLELGWADYRTRMNNYAPTILWDDNDDHHGRSNVTHHSPSPDRRICYVPRCIYSSRLTVTIGCLALPNGAFVTKSSHVSRAIGLILSLNHVHIFFISFYHLMC